MSTIMEETISVTTAALSPRDILMRKMDERYFEEFCYNRRQEDNNNSQVVVDDITEDDDDGHYDLKDTSSFTNSSSTATHHHHTNTSNISDEEELNLSIECSSDPTCRRELVDEEEQKQFFEQIVTSLETNSVCADCGQVDPTWASTSIGVFLCIACCGCHRQLGTHVSKVKSLSLDRWDRIELERMKNLGNEKVNQMLEPVTRHLSPIVPTSSREERIQYITAKYISDTHENNLMSPLSECKSPMISRKSSIADISFDSITGDCTLSPANSSSSSTPGRRNNKGLLSRAKSFVEKRRGMHRRSQSSTEIGMVEFTGILTIHLKRGRDLVSKDLVGSYSDPYCKIWTGPKVDNPKDMYHGQLMKSKVIKKTLNPEWNETMTCCICNIATDALHIKCKDWDRVSLKNDPLGKKTVALKDLGLVSGETPKPITIKLDHVKRGEIDLEISYQQLI